MGLDYTFYRQDETEALRFRNHGEFLEMFTAELEYAVPRDFCWSVRLARRSSTPAKAK